MGNAGDSCEYKLLELLKKIGAGEAIRTPDPNLGKQQWVYSEWLSH